jgi:CRISPR-associated protein Cmx8
MKESAQNLDSEYGSLELRVFSLIKGYVEYKTQAQTGISKPKYDGNPGYRWSPPSKYREACQKTCSNAFYRLRSCKNRENFLQFFADTLCSVPHNLSRENYQVIASALIGPGDAWIDVKTLAMLALSKFSYFYEPSEDTGHTTPKETESVAQ